PKIKTLSFPTRSRIQRDFAGTTPFSYVEPQFDGRSGLGVARAHTYRCRGRSGGFTWDGLLAAPDRSLPKLSPFCAHAHACDCTPVCPAPTGMPPGYRGPEGREQSKHRDIRNACRTSKTGGRSA